MSDDNDRATPINAIELRTLFADFSRGVRDDVNGLGRRFNEHAELMLRTHEGTRRQVVHLTSMTSELWRNVKGSAPPPPPPPIEENKSFVEAAREANEKAAREKKSSGGAVRKPLESLSDQVSEHDGELAAIHGRLMAVESIQKEHGELQKEHGDLQKAHGEKITELLALQKEQMGKKDPDDGRPRRTRIWESILYLVKEREGHKFVLQFIAAVTSLLMAAGTLWALSTGRLPMPNSSVPSPVSPLPPLVSPPLDSTHTR